MNDLQKYIDEFKPLALDGIDWDGFTFSISSGLWRFSTNCPWRLLNAKKLITGCCEKNASQDINRMNKCQITAITTQTVNFPVDPVFDFSDGYRLEIFSTKSKESWRFYLPDGRIIIGSSI